MFELWYPHKNPIGQSGMNPLLWDSPKRRGERRLFKSRQAAEDFAAGRGWTKFLVIPA